MVIDIIIVVLGLVLCGFIGFSIGYDRASSNATKLIHEVSEYYRIKYYIESDEDQKDE